MKVIGYIRVSTEEQADKGVSLDAQEAKIRAWAEVHDHEVVAILGDPGVSGKTLANREGAQTAIREAIEQGAILVVYSISRMSRSTLDLISIADRLNNGGADFVSVTEQHFDTTTPMGRCFYTIMAALAQLERDQTVERTQAALDHKRSRGEALGNTPFGWRNSNPYRSEGEPGGVLVADDDEQATLAKMLELSGGVLNYGQIGRELDRLGLTPRSGGTWDRGSVRRIVRFYGSEPGLRLLSQSQPAPHIGGVSANGALHPAETKEAHAND